jgi:hypothetical protein
MTRVFTKEKPLRELRPARRDESSGRLILNR